MQYQRGVRLFWPIILIGVGSILLFSNIGVIQGNPWSIIFQLWPVMLIALGLEILFGGSTGWRAVVSALLGLGLVGGILWVLIAQPAIPGLNFGSSNLQTTNVSYPLNEVRTARAQISFGVGTNKVHALDDSNNLIEGQLQTYAPVTFNASQSGTQANIQLAPTNTSITVLPFSTGEQWTIGLNSAVTYQIDFNMGVGQSRVDLSRVSLSGGSIEGGVGQSDFWLPASGHYTLRIGGGVGSIRIYVPYDLGVRAEVNGGLGSFNGLPGMRETRNDVYETANFATAANTVTLIIDGGVGSITLLEGE